MASKHLKRVGDAVAPPAVVNSTAIVVWLTMSELIRKECQAFVLGDDVLEEIGGRFLRQVEKGLRRETQSFAEVKCYNTFVQELPDGKEKGKFLALDLGGTNFRVLMVELRGDEDFEMMSKIYAVPQSLMAGSGRKLFDHIAECLASFMREQNLLDEHLPLGFTFSFPVEQLGLTKGILVKWTKGFRCSGVENEDVVRLLTEAIGRRGDISVSIVAILNDTVGTLMSCAHRNHNCKIGVIIGTGCNACYVEKIKNVGEFQGDREKDEVIINTEFGAFGDTGSLDFIRTEFDRIVDKHSINRGTQLHEKMISGMYMGEIVRLVIEKLTRSGLLFGGLGSDEIFEKQRFYTKYVSEIESDKPGDYANCRRVFEELQIPKFTDEDCENVRFICECVSTRAAHLVSCSLATLLNKMDDPRVTIGVDGSVYRFHPKFRHIMQQKIRQLTKPGIEFDLVLSEDGSGRGAALVAAVASRLG